MADPYQHIPEEIKRAAAGDRTPSAAHTASQPKKPDPSLAAPDPIGPEKRQRRLVKYKRAGVVLSKNEVKAIKQGRKKLRKEMRARGIKSRREFELTASSLGLYFDKSHYGFLVWLWRHWLGTLIASLIAALLVMFIYATVQQMRGHFTVNLSDGMFRQGFTLSETADFDNATTTLFANPAEGVPCISISQIPTNIDQIDGEHNSTYFAYTYYIRNEGDTSVGYTWSLDINAETLNVADAVWVMVFEDGNMRFYAKANLETGEAEALPAWGDDSRGYITVPVHELAPDSDQFEIVETVNEVTYWRVIPDTFESDTRVTEGIQASVSPMESHRYTVVMWLEGDDESADDSLIGGHLGVEMNFALADEITEDDDDGNDGRSKDAFGEAWKKFWDNLFSGLS